MLGLQIPEGNRIGRTDRERVAPKSFADGDTARYSRNSQQKFSTANFPRLSNGSPYKSKVCPMLQATSSKPKFYPNHIYKIMQSFRSVLAQSKKVVFESLKAIEDVVVSTFPEMATLLTGAISAGQ